MKEFDEVLLDIFGPKSKELSDDLLTRLRQLYREGTKRGLYLERERLPVPPDVFEVWVRPPDPKDDTRRAPGRYGELEDKKLELLEQSEDLTLEIERRIQPERSLAVGGVDLAKTRHRILTHIDQLGRGIDRLSEQVRRFEAAKE